MATKITELYQKILANDPSVSSLKVAVFHKLAGETRTFTGFLQEDINFGVTTSFSDQLPDLPGISKMIDTVKNGMNTVASYADGSINVVNPLASRMLFQGSSTNGFKVNVTKFCLDGSENLLDIANWAVQLNMPSLGGQQGESSFFIHAPGGYNFPIDKVGNDPSRHANNTWGLWMGGKFAMNHLCCIDLSVTVSKESVKTKSNGLQPLYITLAFEFTPDRMLYLSDMKPGPFTTIPYSEVASRNHSNPGGIRNAKDAYEMVQRAVGTAGELVKQAYNQGLEIAGFGRSQDTSKPSEQVQTPTQMAANDVFQNSEGPSGG